MFWSSYARASAHWLQSKIPITLFRRAQAQYTQTNHLIPPHIAYFMCEGLMGGGECEGVCVRWWVYGAIKTSCGFFRTLSQVIWLGYARPKRRWSRYGWRCCVTSTSCPIIFSFTLKICTFQGVYIVLENRIDQLPKTLNERVNINKSFPLWLIDRESG